MLTTFKNKRSWLLQRLVNRYPPWSAIRGSTDSIGQQLFSHIAKELEDRYWQVNYNLNNRFLLSCDLQQIQNLNRLRLPSTFTFNKTDGPIGPIYKEPSLVKGKLADGSWVTLSSATDNDLREFWYGVPTRVTLAGESQTYRPVLPETQVSAITSAVPGAIGNPGKLWITVSGNSSMVQRYKGQINRASVTLEGYDVFGKELKEKVIFTYNGKVKTQHEWDEITSIKTEYIDDDATIRIDWLPIGNSDHIDTQGLSIDKYAEKFRFFKLSSKSFGSTLQFLDFSAMDFFTVQQGYDTKDVSLEFELLDASGSNISGSWMCIWPNRFYTITTDGSYLHFHYPEVEEPNRESISEKDPEAIVKLWIEKRYGVKNEIVYIDYETTRPFWRILRTRLSVVKPNGTRVCIAEDGSEITFSDSGWVTYTDGATRRNVGFQKGVIEYTPTTTGQYTFYLESVLKNSLEKNSNDPIFQTDVAIYSTSGNTALSSIELPVSVGIASYIAFDGYNQPWVINSSGTAYKLNFHYDYYIVNFSTKEIIAREDYSLISVTS